MTTTSEIGDIELRVVIIDSSSRRVMAVTSDCHVRLLRVSIPRKTRYARQIQIAIQSLLDLAVLVVEFFPVEESEPTCVAVELLATDVPTHCRMFSLDEIPEAELSDLERTQVSLILRDESSMSVSSIGWIDQAITWVEESAGAGLTSKAALEQYSGGRNYSLICFPMQNGKTYWLKATDLPNTHERTLGQVLSRVCAPCLPRIVADRPEWNAWLMTGETRPVPAFPTEPDGLRRLLGYAVSCLAELQKRSAGHEAELLTAGAFDQRLHVMRAHLDSLFTHVAEAISSQSSPQTPYMELSRLQEVHQVVGKVYGRLERLDIPATILHGDINRGNMLFAGDRCQFTDWSDGYVGFPLITLEHLLLLNRIENPLFRDAVNRTLRDAYRLALAGLCDPKQIEQGMICSPLLAAVSALYGRGDWLHTGARNDPRRVRYARCMARHIDLAAQDPILLKTMVA